MESRVFLDASFWIAYRDSREPYHSRAKEALSRLFAQRVRFVTTVPVFCEIHAYFSRHGGRRKTILADFWKNPIVEFENTTYIDQEAAVNLLKRHEDKSFSFCDALSFVVMQRLKVCRVATFDEHFRQVGEFVIIP